MQPSAASSITSTSEIRPLPQSATPTSPGNPIKLASFEIEASQAEPLPAPQMRSVEIETLPSEFPIDLPTALRLANADNLQIALAREQIQQAYAEYSSTGALWLPSLRGGVHWNHHDGTLLSSSGQLRDLSRSSLYAGMGGQAVGGGSPAVPGLFANFKLADAIFQPLAAQQRWGAREHAAAATRNNTLLDVAIGYLELLRAEQDFAIAADIRDKVKVIHGLTESFVRTGQSPQSDADRMRVEVGLRELEVRRSQEAAVIASARLTQLLQLEPCVRLRPIEPTIVPLCFVSPHCDCAELVAQALMSRPELMQNRYLVGEAVQRLRQEQAAPLLPSLLMGTSYGGFGGGRGGDINGFSERFDFDATAYWELRNLGFGDAAARQNANSRLRQAQLQELSTLDQVAREVAETHAQLQIRVQQVATAQELVGFAAESYEHNLIRIRGGQGLPIEVLQSVQALSQARREYLRSVVDYNAAQFSLQRALGWAVGAPVPAEPHS